jgi:hypothetical protein
MNEDKQSKLNEALKKIEEQFNNPTNRFKKTPITVETIINTVTTADFVWYCTSCEAVGMHRNLEAIQDEAKMHAEPWGANETSDCSMYILDMQDRKVYGYLTGYEMGSCTSCNCDCDEEEEAMQFLYDLEEGSYAGLNERP